MDIVQTLSLQILTPKLYFTEPRDGQAQLETPASGSTCVEDNTHVCVKVNNGTFA